MLNLLKIQNTTAKHRAFHNLGNVLWMKRITQAVEAYKNALRNDPSDEETRYNYALAKKC
jgi:cytochrome c-type biogenesis protein CcmH/NrfG